jgi:hypothetical protein
VKTHGLVLLCERHEPKRALGCNSDRDNRLRLAAAFHPPSSIPGAYSEPWPSSAAAVRTASEMLTTCDKAGVAKPAETVGMSYGALRKGCLEAVRHWPGCETIGGIQIIRDNTPGRFHRPGDVVREGRRENRRSRYQLRTARETSAFPPDRMIRPRLSSSG